MGFFMPANCRLVFLDRFRTPSFEANAFAKRPDFIELADRFGLRPPRVTAILERFASERPKVEALLDRSLLSSESHARYRAVFADRLIARAY
jgi:hypothetical protein